MDCLKTKCDTEAAAGLPDEPLVDILSCVPVKSLCRFKCVSKGWRDLIADPFHRKNLPQTLEGFFFAGVEYRDSDSSSEDCGSDHGYGEHGGTDGSDDEEPPFIGVLQRSVRTAPRRFYGFIDVLQRSVRTVDFSYLSELPGPGILEETRLLHCCNGLLLFAVHYSDCDISASYIVCNPATKQCVAVPSSGLTWHQIISVSTATSLLFNPGVRWHFNLVQVFEEGDNKTSGCVYSSETRAWSHNKIDWGSDHIAPYFPGVYVNDMLHLLSYLGKNQLIVVDVKGNIQKIIPAPCQVGSCIWPLSGYIGQSQGCLYYICHELKSICDGFRRRPKNIMGRLLIWVLQDYDRQHWVLKDSVSFSQLFGERNFHMDSAYDVVGIHPDHSLVFLVQHWERKLISYNMDSKEVCDLCTLGHGYKSIVDLRALGHGYMSITPYVPYFSEFGA